MILVIDSSNILSYIGTTEEIRDMLSNLTKISEPVLKKFFPEKSLKFNKQFERTFDEFMKNTGQNIAEGFLTAKSKDNLTFLELMEKNNGNVQLWDVVSFSLDQFYKTTLGEFFLKNHIDTEMIMNILKEINNLIPLVDLSSTIYASAKNLVETFRMVYDLVGSVDAFLNDLKKKKVRK